MIVRHTNKYSVVDSCNPREFLTFPSRRDWEIGWYQSNYTSFVNWLPLRIDQQSGAHWVNYSVQLLRIGHGRVKARNLHWGCILYFSTMGHSSRTM